MRTGIEPTTTCTSGRRGGPARTALRRTPPKAARGGRERRPPHRHVRDVESTVESVSVERFPRQEVVIRVEGPGRESVLEAVVDASREGRLELVHDVLRGTYRLADRG